MIDLLSVWAQVKDDLLVKIASRRQNVTEINISDCRNVQDHGVCSLASNCPGLIKYTAYRCKQLSDVSLCTVAGHCPLLQKLHVGNQDKLTDHALKLVSWPSQTTPNSLDGCMWWIWVIISVYIHTLMQILGCCD